MGRGGILEKMRERLTLSSDDLRDMFRRWHGHALRHVLRLASLEFLELGQRLSGAHDVVVGHVVEAVVAVSEAQHGQLQSQLDGPVVGRVVQLRDAGRGWDAIHRKI